MRKILNTLSKSFGYIFIGIIILFIMWVAYEQITLEFIGSFTYLLVNICIGLIWGFGLYLYDSKTVKKITDSHGHHTSTSSVSNNRFTVKNIVGLFTLIQIILSQYIIVEVGLSLSILPSILSSLMWLHYFGMFFKEVNTNKIGLIMSQITNQPLRQEEEGPIITIPFNERTTLNEKGDNPVEEISDKLIPRNLSVALRTSEGKKYTGVFTFWIQWAKNRSAEIREFEGGQQGLLQEVDKYVETEAQKIAGTKTCRQTIDNLGDIISLIEEKVRFIVGNADEREPITIGEKTFIMKRENDEEIAQYLHSSAITELIKQKMTADPTMTIEAATHQVNLEQKLANETTLRTTGPGSVIASVPGITH